MRSVYVVLLILILALASPSLAAYSCSSSPDNLCQATCQEQDSNGEKINLDISKIIDYPNEIDVGSKHSDGAQSFIFSCSGKDNDCSDVTTTSVCMIGTGSGKKSCGSASLAAWKVHTTCPDYFFSIEYTGGDCVDNLECLSSVINFVQTDQSTTSIQFTRVGKGENGAKQYIFNVNGSSIGQPSCGGGNSGSVVGIVGIVLILLALVAVIVYFVVGSLLLHYTRGATGKEIIPHVDFWTSLPGLIKDGCLFVIGPCRRRYESGRYDSL